MEEKDEIQQSQLPPSEEIIEEKPNNGVETNRTVISNEQNQEEAKENGTVSDAENVGETKEKEQAISSPSQKGKAKVGGKQRKAKPTTPQPFSLATERRMSSREKRNGVDSDHPILKSTSFNYKYHAQTSQTVESNTQVRLGTAVNKSTSLRSLPTGKPTENQQEEKELELKKPRKSPTLRASPSPLPTFNKKAPQNPQLKKIPLTRPQLHQGNRSISESLPRQSKSISELRNNKMEAFKRSTSISKLRNNKMEAITENSSTKITSANTMPSESRTTKPEALHRRSKSISELSNNKMEAFKRSKSICESGNTKMEAVVKKDFKTASVCTTSSESRTTKPEAIHRRSKSISELSNNKPEVFNGSKPICKSENNKMGGVIKNGSKNTTMGPTSLESRTTKPEAVHKSTSRTISSSAKEAINRLLRGSWKASNKLHGESVKGGKSFGARLGKDGVISSNEGKGLAVSG